MTSIATLTTTTTMTKISRFAAVLLTASALAASTLWAPSASATDHDLTWEGQALRFQAKIDRYAPLRDAIFPHTHNSYNNQQDYPWNATNHKLSIENQLRYGIRSLTFDVVADGTSRKLCHGVCLGPEDSFSTGLRQIRTFLEDVKHTQEVVHLKLSLKFPLTNKGSWLRKLKNDLKDVLGDRLYTPNLYHGGDSICTEFKNAAAVITKQDILDAGRNVIVTTDDACKYSGASNFDSYAFKGDFTTYNIKQGQGSKFHGYPECAWTKSGESFDRTFLHSNFIRFYESTLSDDHANLDSDLVSKLVKCGVNAVAPAPLQADMNAHRRQVWSWAKDYPVYSASASLAYVAMDYRTGDYRFHNTASSDEWSDVRAYACVNENDMNDWRISETVGDSNLFTAISACRELGSQYQYATPHNGYLMSRLAEQLEASVHSEAWVRYENIYGHKIPYLNSWGAVTYFSFN